MDTHITEPPGCCPLEQAAEVVDVAVNAAIGAEADQVQTATVGQQSIG
jgi:hypothetical protein